MTQRRASKLATFRKPSLTLALSIRHSICCGARGRHISVRERALPKISQNALWRTKYSCPREARYFSHANPRAFASSGPDDFKSAQGTIGLYSEFWFLCPEWSASIPRPRITGEQKLEVVEMKRTAKQLMCFNPYPTNLEGRP